MDFLLDPYIIAVPNTDSPAVISQYAEALFKWSDMVRSKRHTFWLSSVVAMALTNNNQYPYFSILKRYSHHAGVLQAYDVYKKIERDFMHPDYLDEHLANGYCDYDAEHSIVLPQEIEIRLHPEVARALKETLALMAVADRINNSELARNLLFASYPLPAPTSKIEVNLDILGDKDIEKIISTWRLVFDPTQLDQILEVSSYWEYTERAIQWGYEQLCSCGTLNRNDDSCPKVVAGKEFNKSIKDLHIDNRPVVIDSIFLNTVLAHFELGAYKRAVKAETGTKHHALQRQKDHQIVREADGATAWRVYLSNIYRLHYWLLPDGSMELSKVGVHNDMTII